MRNKETVVVTGASQGIGAAIVRLFLSRGYRVVATSRSATKAGFAPSADLAVVDGDIGSAETAENVTQTAVAKFGSIDHVVSVTTITASLAENPIAGITASIPMITKGGLEAITLSLSSEFAKNGIRFNAVAPGVVDTPLHQKTPKDFMKRLSPMGTITDARDVAKAVIYLTEAHQVTGEVLHVDGGAHAGRW